MALFFWLKLTTVSDRDFSGIESDRLRARNETRKRKDLCVYRKERKQSIEFHSKQKIC
jgi:hypothetical protein